MLYHQNTLKENKLIMGFMHKDEYEDFIIHQNATVISAEEISEMKQNLSPLIGAQFNVLSIPKEILKANRHHRRITYGCMYSSIIHIN